MEMHTQSQVGQLSPKEARSLIRSGELKSKATSGYCNGYKQANIAIVHKSIAYDVGRFFELNQGPFPLLGRSENNVLETTLAEGSNISTDVPQYCVYRDGKMCEMVEDLKEFDLSQFSTFYIGCSFSFENALITNNIPIRNLEQKKNVSMFKTNIKCHAVGKLDCNMVVSYRPIPRNLLHKVVSITAQMPDVHGAPVHIGDPDAIGIKDVNSPDFGDAVEMLEGDVPVFWCCGVSLRQMLISAASPLAFTHSPGCMFITDVPVEESVKCFEESTCAMRLSDDNECYSVASKQTLKILQQLEKHVAEDMGNRGIAPLVIEGDFVRSAFILSHAQSIALVTGFPCNYGISEPLGETDGLPGILCLKRILDALGKSVTIITDETDVELSKKICNDACKKGLLRQSNVIAYNKDFQLLNENGVAEYDVILASERSGRAQDGKYYGMKGRDISPAVDPIDDLFEAASKHKQITTIGIGDGGNELGMGKVFDKVVAYVNLGSTIACTVPANHLIASGVSNWGCYGLSLAVLALMKCNDHERYLRNAVGQPYDSKDIESLATNLEMERKILKIVEENGIRDGVSPKQVMSVDGLKFDLIHANKIEQMRALVMN